MPLHSALNNAAQPSVKKKIMIVEDMLLVSKGLQILLENAGYEISGNYTSGEEAVEKFKNNIPDLILMDIKLDGEMSGIDAATKIKKTSGIPIIFTTAYSDEKILEGIGLTNPSAYIKKPYDEKELIFTIEIALNRSELDRKIIASDAKYRGLFENSSDPVFIIDNKGLFTDINRAFLSLFGYTLGTIINMPISNLFVNNKDLALIVDAINTGSYINNYDVPMKDEMGGEIKCQITSSVIYNEDNQICGYQGVIRDVTELKKSMERQKNLLDSIVQAMALTVEVRDPYTAGHQKRVAEISVSIAEKMNLSPEKINEIKIAAMLHDLGKIYVPAEILTKPGKISELEFDLIKRHPGIGYEILKGVEFHFPLADIIHQHHERMDGSGYPLHLKGNDILLEARIIAVSDTVEAVASHRPYRPAMGLDAAVKIVLENKGKHFDPDIVDAFESIAMEGRFNDMFK